MRRVYLGDRDIYGLLEILDSELGDEVTPARRAALGEALHYTREDKLCLNWKKWFVKTVMTRHSAYNCQLNNELLFAKSLAGHPEYTPLLIASTELNGRVYLVYENVSGPSLNDTYLLSRDVPWVARELGRFVDQLRSLELVHNDLKPQNVLLDRRSREIRVTDYEFGGLGQSWDGRAVKESLLFKPRTLAEERVLKSQMERVGGDFRSLYGPGYFENDRYALNKILGLLRNRRAYRRERIRHFATQLIRTPQARPLKEAILSLQRRFSSLTG
jgi:serine/threonine protein kinase